MIGGMKTEQERGIMGTDADPTLMPFRAIFELPFLEGGEDDSEVNAIGTSPSLVLSPQGDQSITEEHDSHEDDAGAGV